MVLDSLEFLGIWGKVEVLDRLQLLVVDYWLEAEYSKELFLRVSTNCQPVLGWYLLGGLGRYFEVIDINNFSFNIYVVKLISDIWRFLTSTILKSMNPS